MNKLSIIIQREYFSRVRKKSFIIMTFLMPILMVGLIMIPLLLSTVKDTKTRTIAVMDESGKYFDRLKSSESYLLVPFYDNINELAPEKRDDYYAYLSIRGTLGDSSEQVVFYAEKPIGMDLKTFIQNQLEDIASNDIIESYKIPELKQIVNNAHPRVATNTILWTEDGQEQKSSSEIAMFIGMFATILIYIFIFSYGSMVLNGVLEEKLNRIVEIIVSSVKPFQLMMGKIIGIAMVGLTQFLLWIVLILVLGLVFTFALGIPMNETVNMMGGNNMTAMTNMQNMNISNDILDNLQVFQSIPWGKIILWFILYFIAGYLLYASLFAAVGGAIDNSDDVQQFTLPLTMPILFGLYAGIYGAMNPDGPLAIWCSFIPFTSPVVMMVRLPFGVPLWELLVSYGILVLTFLVCVKMAAKIYRTGILMYGKKITYKDLWKWLKYKS